MQTFRFLLLPIFQADVSAHHDRPIHSDDRDLTGTVIADIVLQLLS